MVLLVLFLYVWETTCICLQLGLDARPSFFHNRVDERSYSAVKVSEGDERKKKPLVMLTTAFDKDSHLVAVNEEGSSGALEGQRWASENQWARLEGDSLRESMNELRLRIHGNEVSDPRERTASARRKLEFEK
jgi:hypothetical protein